MKLKKLKFAEVVLSVLLSLAAALAAWQTWSLLK